MFLLAVAAVWQDPPFAGSFFLVAIAGFLAHIAETRRTAYKPAAQDRSAFIAKSEFSRAKHGEFGFKPPMMLELLSKAS